MKITMLISVLCLSLVGCSADYDLQRSTLSGKDEVEVISANVSNPYPECQKDVSAKRVADLSVARSERVYIQGGILCKIAQ